jgi:hypothetical protein
MILMEAKMDQFVGLDVSQEMTHLCVIGGDGKIVWRENVSQRLKTSPEPSDRKHLMLRGLDSKAVLCPPGIGMR